MKWEGLIATRGTATNTQMLPTVTFVGGRISPSTGRNTVQGNKTSAKLLKPTSFYNKAASSNKQIQTTVRVEINESRVTRSRTWETGAAKQRSVPLTRLSSAKGRKELCLVVGHTSLPPWVEQNYEIPTRMGPYSLSRYVRTNSVAVLRNPKRAAELRLMELRTCVRRPASESGDRRTLRNTKGRLLKPSCSKPFFPPSTDTSPPSSPPCLLPSYNVRTCPKHPARWNKG